jgi:hypothetical protein
VIQEEEAAIRDKGYQHVRRLILRTRIVWVMAAFAIVVATVPIPAQTLDHLRGIGEIRDWFNAGRGHVRLILLLSPT